VHSRRTDPIKRSAYPFCQGERIEVPGKVRLHQPHSDRSEQAHHRRAWTVGGCECEGHSTVPTILLEHLTEDQRRAYIIADNRLAEKAGWDKEILEIELHLVTVGFNVEVTGFEGPEVDLILDAAAEKEQDPGPEDEMCGMMSPQSRGQGICGSSFRTTIPATACLPATPVILP